MNSTRRAMIRKAGKLIEDAYNLIDIAFEQEDEALSNMPENLWYGEKYSKMENYVDKLEDARSLLDDANNAVSQILD